MSTIQPKPHVVQLDPLLREPARRKATGISRSAWYEMMEKGRAPKPVRIGGRSVAWRTSDLISWMASLESNGSGK